MGRAVIICRQCGTPATLVERPLLQGVGIFNVACPGCAVLSADMVSAPQSMADIKRIPVTIAKAGPKEFMRNFEVQMPAPANGAAKA